MPVKPVGAARYAGRLETGLPDRTRGSRPETRAAAPTPATFRFYDDASPVLGRSPLQNFTGSFSRAVSLAGSSSQTHTTRLIHIYSNHIIYERQCNVHKQYWKFTLKRTYIGPSCFRVTFDSDCRVTFNELLHDNLVYEKQWNVHIEWWKITLKKGYTGPHYFGVNVWHGLLC